MVEDPAPNVRGESAGVILRRAAPVDREGILEVSACFDNDWIPYAIDRLLGGVGCARFYVAEIGDRIAAVCAAEKQSGGAWLEAMRVRPDIQSRGLATALTEFILNDCAAWDCRFARLSTAVTNAPVHRLIGEKLGFHPLGRWVWAGGITDFQALPAAAGAEAAGDPGVASVREARPDELERVWTFIQTRFRDGSVNPAHLVCPPEHRWSLVDFTRDVAGKLLESGAVLISESGPAAAIDALAVMMPESGHWGPCLAFLEGVPPRVRALLAAALSRAAGSDPRQELLINLPASQWETLRRVVRPGWPPDGPSMEAVIYHRELGQT